MAIMKGRADAGQGGKRGHSNMDHWVYNDEVKEAARKQRRLDAKQHIAGGLMELAEVYEDNQSPPPAASDIETGDVDLNQR
jgi:hypothetical protein